jgi:hypothetical protein
MSNFIRSFQIISDKSIRNLQGKIYLTCDMNRLTGFYMKMKKY